MMNHRIQAGTRNDPSALWPRTRAVRFLLPIAFTLLAFGGAMAQPAGRPSGTSAQTAPTARESRAGVQAEASLAAKAQDAQQARWDAVAKRALGSMCRGCTGPTGRRTPLFLGDSPEGEPEAYRE
jgi:hypothetical protein